MLNQLRECARVVGVKQVRRALTQGRAKAVFLADDADPILTAPLVAQAEQQGLPVCRVTSMRELGRACGIPVGAAVAAMVRG